MKFAKIVFWIAAIWGFLIITPLYLIFDMIGKQDPPPVTHPGFYYGFAGLELVWALAFAFIARDPVRLRPMIIPSIFEKFVYVATVFVLVYLRKMHHSELMFVGADLFLGILFVLAYRKTAGADRERTS